MNAYYGRQKRKLAFGWMLKTAVLNSTKQFRLEQEVPEPGAVDPDVAPGGLFEQTESDRRNLSKRTLIRGI
jgi:hypothetical protein